ncbi:proton-coupled folate transporter-like [Diadema antillarum]|uniref:proton-coupled folate transporter-like n=1 Tax=Diadema antillarum TaxID=105358 RepID=UPI003A8B52CD
MDEDEEPLTSSTQITASADNSQRGLEADKTKRFCHITVEPVIFFMMLCYGLFIPLRLQYLTDRIAQDQFNITYSNRSKNDILCQENASDPHVIINKETEHAIQQQVLLWSLYLSVATSLPALFCTTMIGAHSDLVGRKVALIVPSIGFCVYAAVYLVVTLLEKDIAYLLIGHFALGVCGDFSLLLAGCFSYMADITTKKERAFRIILLDCLSFTAAGIAQIGVGYWIQASGFLYPYVFILACVTMTTMYVIFLVPDTHQRSSTSVIHARDAPRRILNLIQSNTHQRRLPLLIATIVMVIRVLVFFSLPSLTILYGMGDPFCWKPWMVGIFSAAQYVSGALGMIIGGKVLSKQLGDGSLIQVGLISSILCIVLTGAAKTNALLYAVPAVGLFRALSLPMLRTVMSKLVYPSEQGVMFACIGCLQSLTMVISPVTFNNIYYVTIRVNPGIVFFVMAGCLVVASLLTIILQVKKQESSFLLLQDPLTTSVNGNGRSLVTGRPRNNQGVPSKEG